MRVGLVGAGLAGLATAAAFRRSGHEVTVYEQADGLRASGLAINLWSNATSLLPALGLPADRIPGEPFSKMLRRADQVDLARRDYPEACTGCATARGTGLCGAGCPGRAGSAPRPAGASAS